MNKIIYCSDTNDIFEKIRLKIDELKGTQLKFKVSLIENKIIIPKENIIIKYKIKEV